MKKILLCPKTILLLRIYKGVTCSEKIIPLSKQLEGNKTIIIPIGMAFIPIGTILDYTNRTRSLLEHGRSEIF